MREIFLALQSGRAVEAEQLSRQLLHGHPDNHDVRLLLALALHQQRKLDDALTVYGEGLRQRPDDAVCWGNYATALRDAGRFTEALEAYRRSLALFPENAEQWINLGLLQLHLQDFVGARDSLFEALRLQPESPEVRIRAARACTMCRDYRAEELLHSWRDWLPLEDGLQLELADLQSTLGEANIARLLLEDLLVRNPSHLAARLLLAAVYERVNQLDTAEVLLRQLAVDFPGPEEAIRVEIAHQQAVIALRRGEPAQAREIMLTAGPRSATDYAHYFELAAIEDKLGDCPAAIGALRKAHALQVDELRITAPHRLAADAPLLPAAVARLSLEDYRRWPRLSAPDAANSPVFIVGFPRSGTTLLEQMLDAHPRLQSMDERPFFNILSDRMADGGVRVPDDLYRLGQFECDTLRKDYLALVCSKISRRWDAQLVDKNPLNMLWVPFIHRLFPNARFILALRHPCDVVLSNYMQNYRASAMVAACASIERLAAAYVAAMDSWLYHVDLVKPQVFVSRYEDLVADPAAQTRRIADFLGLDDAGPMLQFDRHARDKGYIATPSYTQVIQPVNTKGLGRWLRYRRAMAVALPILAPMLERWGYEVPPDSAG